ncbi:MAG: hypothetical protein HY549_07820 [Elusimicrobia bacterium]|nr:hypothetical protein [Elusimicrobiota bacterium]
MFITPRLALALALAIASVLLLGNAAKLDERLTGVAGIAILITWVCLAIIHWSVIRPLNGLLEWMRGFRFDGNALPPPSSRSVAPLAEEAAQLARSLAQARAAAEQEARLRHRGEAVWTAEKLKEHVKTQLQGKPLFLVSNREPYEHVRRGKDIVVKTPPSGLVTGIEPVLRACGRGLDRPRLRRR